MSVSALPKCVVTLVNGIRAIGATPTEVEPPLHLLMDSAPVKHNSPSDDAVPESKNKDKGDGGATGAKRGTKKDR